MVSYLATATIAASLLAAAPDAPQWESDYGKALAATRADEMPLLVVLDLPAEEANVEETAAETETEAEVQQVSHATDVAVEPEAEALEPYRLCKIDASTEYGKKVAKAFNVSSYPYTAIIDKTGSVIIFAKSGTMSDTQWSTTLADYKSGDRTETMVMTSRANTSNVTFQRSSDYTPSNYCPSCQRNRGY